MKVKRRVVNQKYQATHRPPLRRRRSRAPRPADGRGPRLPPQRRRRRPRDALIFDLAGAARSTSSPARRSPSSRRSSRELARRTDIGCLVLLSGKPAIFIAGADVEEIAGVTDPAEAEAASRLGQRALLRLGGAALPHRRRDPRHLRRRRHRARARLDLPRGRATAPDLRIGLPEIRLGILPGWGGCTRLPRRVGHRGGARHDPHRQDGLRPARAAKIGLVDALLPDAGFLDRARDFALARLGKRPRRERRRGGLNGARCSRATRSAADRALDQARKKTLAETKGHYPAPLRALEVVRIGIERRTARRLRRRGAGRRRARRLARSRRTWSTSST